MAVAVGISVAMAVTAGFIGFGATIRTHREIQWSHICQIIFIKTTLKIKQQQKPKPNFPPYKS